MANTIVGNKIYIDSTGLVADTRQLVVHALFTPAAADDKVILRESSGGSDVLILQAATAKDTKHFSFELVPMLFTNGIYIQTITSGAKLTLITTSKGRD